MLTNQRRVYVDQSVRKSSRFVQSEQSSRHVVDGHPRGVTKGRRRFLYHKTSSDDSGCGSAKVCLPQLCRMPKENDPGLCSTPHCEDDSEVLPTYSTEARGHLHVEHDVAESILGVSVEDFEELNDDQRRTVVWPVIGMRKTVDGVYTNYTVESIDTEPIV